VQGEQLLEKNPAPPAFLCCSRILVVRGHQQMHLLANIEWRPFDSAVGSADNRFLGPGPAQIYPMAGPPLVSSRRAVSPFIFNGDFARFLAVRHLGPSRTIFLSVIGYARL
jgi:hypothetical protein